MATEKIRALALAAIDAVPLHPDDTAYWAEMLERTGLASEELTDQEWQFAAACDPVTILALLDELAKADNPEWDATDAAHPAWWRGHDHVAARFGEELAKARAELAAERAKVTAAEFEVEKRQARIELGWALDSRIRGYCQHPEADGDLALAVFLLSEDLKAERATVEAMRPIVEAARAWRNYGGDDAAMALLRACDGKQ